MRTVKNLCPKSMLEILVLRVGREQDNKNNKNEDLEPLLATTLDITKQDI